MSYHRLEHFKPRIIKPYSSSLRCRIRYTWLHWQCQRRGLTDRTPTWLKTLGRDLGDLISVFQRSRRPW